MTRPDMREADHDVGRPWAIERAPVPSLSGFALGAIAGHNLVQGDMGVVAVALAGLAALVALVWRTP